LYGKIFSQIYDGTLASNGPWQALVTFQQLIILADQDGVVDMTPEAISRRTSIPHEIIAEGLSALEQPDPDSRSAAEEGRRIVRLSPTRSWGWRLVNYEHYRNLRTESERRAYQQQYYHENKAKQNQVVTHDSTISTVVNNPQHDSTISTSLNKFNTSRSRSRSRSISKSTKTHTVGCDDQFDQFWKAYPRKDGKQKAKIAWGKHDPSVIPDLFTGLARAVRSEQWKRGVIPHPATWLNQRRWEDEGIDHQVIPQAPATGLDAIAAYRERRLHAESHGRESGLHALLGLPEPNGEGERNDGGDVGLRTQADTG